MCRIYGYLGNNIIADEVLHKVAISQIKGGPDTQYKKKTNNWIFGINRLAIQGLNGGIQPFCSNRINAIFNGEIYNYKELRDFLITKHYVFNDNCDGSVIIPLYETYGEDFVKYLDGMFSIVIIDERTETKLVIVNDTSAIKSIYYYWDKSRDDFYFASELVGLFEFNVPKKLRLEAVDEYIIGHTTWHSKTFFKDIFTLEPSMLLTKTRGCSPKLQKYKSNISDRWDPSLNFDQNARFPNYILRRVDHLSMANSVEVRVPFCQPRISSFSRSLPNEFLLNENSGKRIIYQAAYNKLPQSVLTRPKQPFTLPIIDMLKKDFVLFDILYSTLTSKSFLSRGFFNYEEIKLLINRHLNDPQADTANVLWSLMILELWLQHIESNLSL